MQAFQIGASNNTLSSNTSIDKETFTIDSAAEKIVLKVLQEESYSNTEKRAAALHKLFGALSLSTCKKACTAIAHNNGSGVKTIASDVLEKYPHTIEEEQSKIIATFLEYLKSKKKVTPTNSPTKSTQQSSSIKKLDAAQIFQALVNKNPYYWLVALKTGLIFWTYNPVRSLDNLLYPTIKTIEENLLSLFKDYFDKYGQRISQIIQVLDTIRNPTPLPSQFEKCLSVLFSRPAICYIPFNKEIPPKELYISWAKMIMGWRDYQNDPGVNEHVHNFYSVFFENPLSIATPNHTPQTTPTSSPIHSPNPGFNKKKATALKVQVQNRETQLPLPKNILPTTKTFSTFLAEQTVTSIFICLGITQEEVDKFPISSDIKKIFQKPDLEYQLVREYISVYIFELCKRFYSQAKNDVVCHPLWKKWEDEQNNFSYLEILKNTINHYLQTLLPEEQSTLNTVLEAAEIILTVHLYKISPPSWKQETWIKALIPLLFNSSSKARNDFRRSYTNIEELIRVNKPTDVLAYRPLSWLERLGEALNYVIKVRENFRIKYNNVQQNLFTDYQALDILNTFLVLDYPEKFIDFLQTILEDEHIPDSCMFEAYLEDQLFYNTIYGLIYQKLPQYSSSKFEFDLDSFEKMYTEYKQTYQYCFYTQAPLNRLNYLLRLHFIRDLSTAHSNISLTHATIPIWQGHLNISENNKAHEDIFLRALEKIHLHKSADNTKTWLEFLKETQHLYTSNIYDKALCTTDTWIRIILLIPDNVIPNLKVEYEVEARDATFSSSLEAFKSDIAAFFKNFICYCFSHIEYMVLLIRIFSARKPEKCLKTLQSCYENIKKIEEFYHFPFPQQVVFSALFYLTIHGDNRSFILDDLLSTRHRVMTSDAMTIFTANYSETFIKAFEFSLQDQEEQKQLTIRHSEREQLPLHSQKQEPLLLTSSLKESELAYVLPLDGTYHGLFIKVFTSYFIPNNSDECLKPFVPLMPPIDNTNKALDLFLSKLLTVYTELYLNKSNSSIQFTTTTNDLNAFAKSVKEVLYSAYSFDTVYEVSSDYPGYTHRYTASWVIQEDDAIAYQLTLIKGWADPQTQTITVTLPFKLKFLQKNPDFAFIMTTFLHLSLTNLFDFSELSEYLDQDMFFNKFIEKLKESDPKGSDSIRAAFCIAWDTCIIDDKLYQASLLVKFARELKYQIVQSLIKIMLSNPIVRGTITTNAASSCIYTFEHHEDKTPIFSIIPVENHSVSLKHQYMFHLNYQIKEVLTTHVQEAFSHPEPIQFTIDTVLAPIEIVLQRIPSTIDTHAILGLHITSSLKHLDKDIHIEYSLCHTDCTEQELYPNIIAWQIAITMSKYYQTTTNIE